MQHIDNGDVIGHPVDDQVVGVDYGFACARHTTGTIEVWVLGKRLGSFFDGVIQLFGGVWVALSQVTQYFPERFTGLG